MKPGTPYRPSNMNTKKKVKSDDVIQAQSAFNLSTFGYVKGGVIYLKCKEESLPEKLQQDFHTLLSNGYMHQPVFVESETGGAPTDKYIAEYRQKMPKNKRPRALISSTLLAPGDVYIISRDGAKRRVLEVGEKVVSYQQLEVNKGKPFWSDSKNMKHREVIFLRNNPGI